MDSEVIGCNFQDTRLGKRFGTLLKNLWRGSLAMHSASCCSQ
ncbi:transposase DNA-binding-containing protein [Caballeronia udeis]